MFYNAIKFNSDLSGWNVSNVTTMRFMFKNVRNFNSNINEWDISDDKKYKGVF